MLRIVYELFQLTLTKPVRTLIYQFRSIVTYFSAYKMMLKLSSLSASLPFELKNFENLTELKLNDSKIFLPSVLGTAALASYLWFRYFHSSDDGFPDLANRHWLKGHMPLYRASKCHGKLLEQLNKFTNSGFAYLRSYPGGTHRLILFNFSDLKDLFFTHGQESIGRNFGVSVHQGSEAREAIVEAWGPVWKNNRKIFHNHLRSFGRERQLQMVLDEAKHLSEKLESLGENFEPSELLQSAVFNVITILIFGFRFPYSDPEGDKALRAILTCNKKHMMLPSYIIKILKLFKLSKQAVDVFKAIRTSKSFIREQINARLQGGARETAEALVDAYILDSEKEGKKFDVNNLIAIIFELYFAGTETTSTTLTWVFACLARYPEIQDKIAAEIEAKVGNSELTNVHLKNMDYTIAVQYEIQRFSSTVQMTLPHKMVQEVKLESGSVIKKDETIWANIYHIMRDPKYFKYPEEFNPGNFLDESGTKLKMVEAFVPYGVGPRICLGQTLADLEVKVMMIEIVRRFKITSSDDIDLTDTVQNLTCGPQPYRYNLEPRV